MTGADTTFQDGLIRKELHGKFEAAFHAGIDTCAAVGCPNLMAMPGERRGMPREEAADNAAAILSRHVSAGLGRGRQRARARSAFGPLS